jgi:hypothetical protein
LTTGRKRKKALLLISLSTSNIFPTIDALFQREETAEGRARVKQ